MMYRIKAFIEDFMRNRNGIDLLVIVLFVLFFVIFALGSLTGIDFLIVLSLIPLMTSIFRVLSKDVSKRRRENEAVTAIFASLKNDAKLKQRQFSDKEHKYFKCTNCGRLLRVPKGKGLIEITCPNCGTKFNKRT